LPPCDRIFVEEWKSNILLIFNHHQEWDISISGLWKIMVIIMWMWMWIGIGIGIGMRHVIMAIHKVHNLDVSGSNPLVAQFFICFSFSILFSCPNSSNLIFYQMWSILSIHNRLIILITYLSYDHVEHGKKKKFSKNQETRREY
jgi:hypothetical protein